MLWYTVCKQVFLMTQNLNLLFYTTFCNSVLQCILYYTLLYYTAQHYTILYYTILLKMSSLTCIN